MESGKQSSKKIPKKRRSLRINMPVSRWSISKFPQLPKIRRVQWVSASTHRFSHFVCIFFGIVIDRSPLSQLPFSTLKCSVTSVYVRTTFLVLLMRLLWTCFNICTFLTASIRLWSPVLAQDAQRCSLVCFTSAFVHSSWRELSDSTFTVIFVLVIHVTLNKANLSSENKLIIITIWSYI